MTTIPFKNQCCVCLIVVKLKVTEQTNACGYANIIMWTKFIF